MHGGWFYLRERFHTLMHTLSAITDTFPPWRCKNLNASSKRNLPQSKNYPWEDQSSALQSSSLSFFPHNTKNDYAYYAVILLTEQSKGGRESSDPRHWLRPPGHAGAPAPHDHRDFPPAPSHWHSSCPTTPAGLASGCQEQFVLFLHYLRPRTEQTDRWFNFPGPDEHPH